VGSGGGLGEGWLWLEGEEFETVGDEDAEGVLEGDVW
jgi:hypothetical protein